LETALERKGMEWIFSPLIWANILPFYINYVSELVRESQEEDIDEDLSFLRNTTKHLEELSELTDWPNSEDSRKIRERVINNCANIGYNIINDIFETDHEDKSESVENNEEDQSHLAPPPVKSHKSKNNKQDNYTWFVFASLCIGLMILSPFTQKSKTLQHSENILLERPKRIICQIISFIKALIYSFYTFLINSSRCLSRK
jgi:hypothetical protein